MWVLNRFNIKYLYQLIHQSVAWLDWSGGVGGNGLKKRATCIHTAQYRSLFVHPSYHGTNSGKPNRFGFVLWYCKKYVSCRDNCLWTATTYSAGLNTQARGVVLSTAGSSISSSGSDSCFVAVSSFSTTVAFPSSSLFIDTLSVEFRRFVEEMVFAELSPPTKRLWLLAGEEQGLLLRRLDANAVECIVINELSGLQLTSSVCYECIRIFNLQFVVLSSNW